MAKFLKEIFQSCVTSAQFHFSIQLKSKIFDKIRYPAIVKVSKFNASSRRPLTHCECSFSGWGQFLQSFCRRTREYVISLVASPLVIWQIHLCSCKSFAKIVPIPKNYRACCVLKLVFFVCVLTFRTIFEHNIFWDLSVSWCKNKCFWKRFACTIAKKRCQISPLLSRKFNFSCLL